MSARNDDASRLRLDRYLVERGFFDSRSRARDAIDRGAVIIGGKVASKPGAVVPAGAEISVRDPAAGYVSRAALKLAHGLDHFGLDPAGRIALDIGASTGGFTQVLLERSAAHVIAMDVGHGQMAERLRGDPRISVIEGLNARFLEASHLGGRVPDLIVCDVSFISLKLALPPALALAAAGARGLFLVKPQFEAGRGNIGKSGIVAPDIAQQVAADLRDWLDSVAGWRAIGLTRSPIAGSDGNIEFLLAGEWS